VVETSVDQGSYEEGCLSIPEVNADVIRPAGVKVQAWNLKGRPFSMDADALLARVIQHELDHLNGVLFIDRLESKKRERLVKRYEKVAET
jgi:peptide deformylase